MQKLMAVFAHPDDEEAIGGTLACYAQDGVEIMLVCATRGEVGEISDPALATAENLGEVRQRELETACAILGIQQLEFLDYRDSGMKGTPQNEDPRALIQADADQVVGKIVGLIRCFQPDVIITFEPFGWYGHPDHIAVSRWTTEAVSLAGAAGAYPQIEPIWQPSRFYYAVIPLSKFRDMVLAGIAGGYIEGNSFGGDFEQGLELNTEEQVTQVLDIRPFYDQKQKAMMAHKTQFSENHMFQKIPKEIMMSMQGDEYFIQVYPAPDAGLTADPSADLFE